MSGSLASLVCLVYLVYLVGFARRNIRERMNEQTKRTELFSLLEARTQQSSTLAGCSKRPSCKAAASEGPRRTRRVR
jgi:hypothetical protein